MNAYLKTGGLVVASILIFVVLAVTAFVKVQPIQVTLVEPTKVEESEPSSEEQRPMTSEDIAQPVPSPPAPVIPCDGVIIPQARAYVLENGLPFLKGQMRDEYLGCRIHKQVDLGNREFYYVQVTHEGYEQNFYLFSKEDIVFFMKDRSFALFSLN